MKLEVGYLTHKGKRANNEDSLLVRQIGDTWVLAVADGLGGHAAGEVASKMALIEIEEFSRRALRENRPPSQELVREAVAKANREIWLLSRENPSFSGMGTTLVLAVVTGTAAVIATVGDSRAYLIGEDIEQRTKDHSLVQELVDAGEISSSEAAHHPKKNIVTRALGISSSVEPDILALDLAGGTLLLCSDGLTDSLSDDRIHAILTTIPDLDVACSALIVAANEQGGEDNTTVILAREFGSGSPERVL